MGDKLTSIFTHGVAAGGGYFLGKKSLGNKIVHSNLFSRFIPTVIVAYGIAHFAINFPNSLFEYKEISNNNETKVLLQKDSSEKQLKDKALDKGFDIYGTKNKDYDALKKDYTSLKSRVEFEKQSIIDERNALKDINKQQGERLQNIEGKLDSVLSNKKNSIDEHVQNDNRVHSNYNARNMNDDVKRKTVIYRKIYVDPFGRPYVVEKRKVKRNYN
jgi:hypothetical protein